MRAWQLRFFDMDFRGVPLRKIKRIYFGMTILSCLLVPAVFGNDFEPVSFVEHPNSFSRHDNWFVGASGGVAFSSVANTSQSLANGSSYPSPYNTDLYTIQNPDATMAWSLYGGYRWETIREWFPDINLALRYQHLDSVSVNGTIDQYSLPGFVNYSYTANGSSNALSAFGKVDIYQYRSILPYVSLGLGLAWNTMSYSEQAYNGITPRVSPGYGGTSTNFAYNVGLGLDYILNRRVTLSLGYEYASFGSMSGSGTSTWSSDTLSLGSLSSNTLLFSAFYELPIGY